MRPKLYEATCLGADGSRWSAVVTGIPGLEITAYSFGALKARIASAIAAVYEKSGKSVRVVECDTSGIQNTCFFVAVPTASVSLKNALAQIAILEGLIDQLRVAIEPFSAKISEVASCADTESAPLCCNAGDVRRANRIFRHTTNVDIEATAQIRHRAGEENTTVWCTKTQDATTRCNNRIIERDPPKTNTYTCVAIPEETASLEDAGGMVELLKEHVVELQNALEPFADYARDVSSYSDSDQTCITADVKDLRCASRVLGSTRNIDLEKTVQKRRLDEKGDGVVWRIGLTREPIIETLTARIAELEKALEPFAARGRAVNWDATQCAAITVRFDGSIWKKAAEALPGDQSFRTSSLHWKAFDGGFGGYSCNVLLYKAFRTGGKSLAGWQLYAFWPEDDASKAGRAIKGPIGSSSGVNHFATLHDATTAAEQDLVGGLNQLSQAGVATSHVK